MNRNKKILALIYTSFVEHFIINSRTLYHNTMSETGRIYSITCKVNGKRYIGQTTSNLSQRWAHHLYNSRQQIERPLYQDLNKYGKGMFTIRVIEDDIPVSELGEKERHWVEQFDSYKSGYNLQPGGSSGYSKDEKSVEKQRASMRRHYKNGGYIPAGGSGTHNSVKIKGTHKTTGEVVEFNSLSEASDKMSFAISNICRAIKTGGSAGGYKWEKLEDKTCSYRVYGKRILDGKVIHHYDSLRKAALALGTGSVQGISRALKNPSRYSWKGCRWYREEE